MYRRLSLLEPQVAGALCGILAAVGYTASNVCLRKVAALDPIWVSCVKAVPLVVLVPPFLVARAVRSQGFVPSPRALGLLMLAGLFGQLAGNVAFQWSLGVVGMAMSVALSFGGMIISGALLGRWLLNERVTLRMAVSCLVLIAAIAVLSLGADEANRSVAAVTAADLRSQQPDLRSQQPDLRSQQLIQPVSQWLLVLGLLAPCLSGFAYSVLGVAIRHSAMQGTPVSVILFSVGVIGLLALGPLSLLRLGPDAMLATSGDDLVMMLLAGVANVVAFWALSKALHLASIVFVNGMNASQTAMAAVAGVVFFHEAVTTALIAGVALTIAGLLMMKGRRKPAQAEI